MLIQHAVIPRGDKALEVDFPLDYLCLPKYLPSGSKLLMLVVKIFSVWELL